MDNHHYNHQSIINDYSAYNENDSSCYHPFNNGPNEYSSMESMKSDNNSQSASQMNDSLSLYENDAVSFECLEEALNDGSNTSGSNSGDNSYGFPHNNSINNGSNKKRKANNSKNYIGKQNLSQEFQSNDVAKIRDSENKYIIALQKDMKIVGYRCDWPECEFLTCRKYVMVNHINGKHTNQRPYSCDLCNFTFVKRYFLKAHMYKVHKRRMSLDDRKDHHDINDDCSSSYDEQSATNTNTTTINNNDKRDVHQFDDLGLLPINKKFKSDPQSMINNYNDVIYTDQQHYNGQCSNDVQNICYSKQQHSYKSYHDYSLTDATTNVYNNNDL
ncbi:hypothetical protein BLA29_002737 [Euroglyphus maynei]|uniref:C2H2-type domain-containing protein n=1 Tax=Euroglyphus maynei TaxID=6958 RepID=A0A1Y3BQS0_EURMA|nr:hypothetical protein BLA29_002737 [Euroglyphus maynei]